MPGVRGRFKVNEVRRYDFDRPAAWVLLESVDGDADTAHALRSVAGKATISMMVTNHELVETFPPGKHFYVDFTPVETAKVIAPPR